MATGEKILFTSESVGEGQPGQLHISLEGHEYHC